MTVAVRAHWAHRAAAALEAANITEYSIHVNAHGVYFHLAFKDFLKLVQQHAANARGGETHAKQVGDGMLAYLSLSLKHGNITYCTQQSVDYRKLSLPAGGKSLGRWNPDHQPSPWLVETEQ
jgi:hypothetical protein